MFNSVFRWRTGAMMLLAPVFLAAGPASAQAADWPSKPVTIVVAFPPGGMTDVVSRGLAKELSATFKQPFIVENKAGASGQVATEYAARQAADGYTLLIAATGYVIAPYTRAKINYDPRKDLVSVAALAQIPNVIVVNPAVPAKTVPEFLDWARKQDGVPYATPGAGGSTHLAGELLRKLSDIPFVHVPYRGGAAAALDTISGQLQVGFQDGGTVSPFLRSGQLRAIAITGAKRSALLPDVPTLHESGFKNFDVYTWVGLHAPAGTPPEILNKLNASIGSIMNSPEMVSSLKTHSSEPFAAMDLAQTRQFVEDELTKWSDLVRTTGVKFDD
ncbi:tripartite tricarboxylate transporter substrate binding protein [Alcaligenaceae bacterium]|nr:tripartite tricarboxylate transporter substrate binding protein [Alcaligenaceae bacterium]